VALDRNRIHVEVTLRSGVTQVFEITEDILADLEQFRSYGLSAQELCRAWLQLGPRDPPIRLRVSGRRADDSDVLIELVCDEHSSAHPKRNGTG
jgi:hypothetical protein